MKSTEKVTYALDLEQDGENGAHYLARQFNLYCLEDLYDDETDFARLSILQRAMRYAK